MPVIGLSATVAVIAAACIGVFAVAEPRYVALCSTEGTECATASLTAEGLPDETPQLALVSLDRLNEVELTNRNATGETLVSVVGYFSGKETSKDLGDYTVAEASTPFTVTLAADQTRHIALPNTPKGARAALVQIRGHRHHHHHKRTSTPTVAASESAESAKSETPTPTPSISASTPTVPDTDTTVSVGTGATGVTAEAVREAVRKHRHATGSPSSTPSASATDEIADNVANTVTKPRDEGKTDTETGTSTATPEPAPTESAPVAPPAPAAPEAPPAESVPAAPEAPAPPPVVSVPAPSSGQGTGVPAGVQLRRVDGDQTITTAGTVLDGLDIHGRVIIKAANVTIKNSVIRGTDSGGTKGGLVDAMNGFPGLTIWDSEIVATAPSYSINGIMGSNFELHRVNIHNTVDQVHIAGSNVVVADSWLHGTTHYADDPTHSDGSHDDNIQIVGGDNLLITGTVMEDAQNTGMMITQSWGPVSRLTISNNSIDDGDCMININPKGAGTIQALTVTGNTFGLHSSISRCAVYSPSNPVSMSGNSYADGVAALLRTS